MFHRLTTSYTFQTVTLRSTMYVLLFPFVSDISVGHRRKRGVSPLPCYPYARLCPMVSLGNINSDGCIAVAYSMWSCTKQTDVKLQLHSVSALTSTQLIFVRTASPSFSGLPKMASSSQTKRTELSTVYHNVAFLAICKRTIIKHIYQFVLRDYIRLSEKLLSVTATC
jgi:hypothetical protein